MSDGWLLTDLSCHIVSSSSMLAGLLDKVVSGFLGSKGKATRLPKTWDQKAHRATHAAFYWPKQVIRTAQIQGVEKQTLPSCKVTYIQK